MSFLLLVLGSLGLFMYGMKTLSSGLQKAAGQNLRELINRIAYNDFSGLITGLVLTLLVQSSMATTVLFVGLANAGLITLRQSITLILGANIGTTIKALLLAYSGANINLEVVALVLAAFGLPILFTQRNTFKALADVLIGLAIMLLSVNLIKSSLVHVDQNEYLTNILNNAAKMGFAGNLIALATGLLLTMIVQSSSAIMTLTLLLSQKGILSFEMAAAMIIGENIGTTVTVNLAAIVANKNGKRVALWHTLFNCFGALWAMLLFYPMLNALDVLVQNTTSHGSPFVNNEARTFALAYLHVGFNVVNAFILIWFTPQIEKLLLTLVKDKVTSPSTNEFSLQYIQSGIINSAELDMLNVKKAIEHMGKINTQMFNTSGTLLTRNENSEFYDNLKKIRDLEAVNGKMDNEISNFLNKITENDISKITSNNVRAYVTTTKELYGLSSSIYQLSKIYERKLLQRIWFNPTQREGIKILSGKITLILEDMNHLLEHGKFDSNSIYEDRKSNLFFTCTELKEKHLESIEDSDFNIKSGTIYVDLIGVYNRIGEQIVAVCNNFKN